MRKRTTRAANSHSGHSVQHWDIYFHGHLRHPIENVIPHHRIELHEKPPSSN